MENRVGGHVGCPRQLLGQRERERDIWIGIYLTPFKLNGIFATFRSSNQFFRFIGKIIDRYFYLSIYWYIISITFIIIISFRWAKDTSKCNYRMMGHGLRLVIFSRLDIAVAGSKWDPDSPSACYIILIPRPVTEIGITRRWIRRVNIIHRRNECHARRRCPNSGQFSLSLFCSLSSSLAHNIQTLPL